MRAFIIISVLLIANPLFAQEPLQLRHALVSVQTSATVTTATYRLELVNTSVHNLHSINLSLQDIGLSLTLLPDAIHFQSLPAGQQKHRLMVIDSALSAEQLAASILLFQVQSVDAFGQPDTFLLRSEMRP